MKRAVCAAVLVLGISLGMGGPAMGTPNPPHATPTPFTHIAGGRACTVIFAHGNYLGAAFSQFYSNETYASGCYSAETTVYAWNGSSIQPGNNVYKRHDDGNWGTWNDGHPGSMSRRWNEAIVGSHLTVCPENNIFTCHTWDNPGI
jgi:hypothetical protein